MKPIYYESAVDIGKKIQDGTTSSLEVLNSLLDRISSHNEKVNAIVSMYNVEKLRDEAIKADLEISEGNVRSPLHGVPVTIKDSYCVKDLPATIGHMPLKDFVPDFDATVVQRLRDAGAIIVGKTNVPTLLMDQQSVNPIYGATNNPWNYDFTSGGSSGGSAASIASGFSFLEIGSDIGGSVRLPAHFCGVYSLKTTESSVSSYGHMEKTEADDLKLLRHLCTYGPLARSIDDLISSYSIISGFDGKDISIPTSNTSTHSVKNIKSMKIAYFEEFEDYPVSKNIKEHTEKFVSKLESIGVEVIRLKNFPLDINKVWKTYGNLFFSELQTPDPNKRHEELNLMNTPCMKDIEPPMTLEKYYRTLTTRESLVREFDEFISNFDMFIMPVTRTQAFPHVQAPFDKKPPLKMDQGEIGYFTNILYTTPFNVLQNPVVTIPIGVSEDNNLPIGVQCVGRMWHDLELMKTANEVTKALKLESFEPSLK